ncbi:hypothetical protein BST38_22080 [Mycolicibacterium parafortuitum]|nr:hypothetical protein BST38_22080 [Mycolicibacterium parafortuitum]
MLGTIAGLAVTTAVGLAAPAGAAPQDAAFLNRLQQVGITVFNSYTTIQGAYAICRELDLGTPHSRVVALVLAANSDLDWESAADYVVLANMTYCPPR